MTVTETITIETAIIQWETQLGTYAALLQTSHSPTMRHIGEDLQTIHHGLTTYRKNMERGEKSAEPHTSTCTPKTLFDMIQEQQAKAQEPTPAADPMPETPVQTDNPVADTTEHQGKSPGRLHPKVNDNHPNHWSEEETSLLRTCPNGEQAIRYYRIYFGNRRNDNGIIQKHNKLRLAGKLIKKGDRVRLNNAEPNTYTKETGIVEKINDERTHAVVKFSNAELLAAISTLEVVA